jgi:hypothetical protein
VYEHRSKRPISRREFARRYLSHLAIALGFGLFSLFLGMAGYMVWEHLPWRDAFVNAAMLLGGMGPVNPLRTDGGKIFAGVYALYAGLVFIIVSGLLVAPIFHRVLHLFAWEKELGEQD